MKKLQQYLSYLTLLAGLSMSSCTMQDKEVRTAQSKHNHEIPDKAGEQYAVKINKGMIPVDTLKGSPLRMSMGFIDGCHIHIIYGSPGVKERIIWGGLVPMDRLWITGAHEATRISFSRAVKINGQKLDAGEYAFFTIPGTKRWTLIFNRKFKQHLTDDYDIKHDALRVEAEPEKLGQSVQRLTYSVIENPEGGGAVTMEWENIRIMFNITEPDVS